MSREIVDAKGCLCPKPLIMTKSALEKIRQGESFVLLIDNATSKENVERFLKENGHNVSIKETQGIYELMVIKKGDSGIDAKPEDYCITPVSGPRQTVIVIKNNKMGLGADELGEILLKAFINTLPEMDPLPQTIVFYNAGIFLAIEGSSVLNALKKLEEKGVKIFVCGTCLDYYKKKDELRVGVVSNMYEIMQVLNRAGPTIIP